MFVERKTHRESWAGEVCSFTCLSIVICVALVLTVAVDFTILSLLFKCLYTFRMAILLTSVVMFMLVFFHRIDFNVYLNVAFMVFTKTRWTLLFLYTFISTFFFICDMLLLLPSPSILFFIPSSTSTITSMLVKVSVKERFIIPESKVPSLMAGAFDLNGEVKRLRDKGYLPYCTHLTHTPQTHNIPDIPYHATHTAAFI